MTTEEPGMEVQKFQAIVATAPEILQSNIVSKEKAIEAGQKLVELAKAGMNDFYDTQLALFQTKTKKTVDSMNERRKPITQIMDAYKKQFTTLESELKPIMDEVQVLRNDWVTIKMKEKKELDRLALLQLNKDKEAIEIKQACEIRVAGYFNECINTRKKEILSFFNELTLETIGEATDVLNTTSTNFDLRFPEALTVAYDEQTSYVTRDEVDLIICDVLSKNYQTKKYEYTREIDSVIRETRDKLPSKKTELEAIEKAAKEEKIRQETKQRAESEERIRQAEIAKAGGAEKIRLEGLAKIAQEEKTRLEAIEKTAQEEKTRLEEEVKKRLADEAEILSLQQLAREQKAQEEAAINASAATAGAMVDAQVITTSVDAKEGYLISLKSTAGYLLLVQFWFEKEGKALSVDKFEKVTFDRVKRFCETYAAKNEEFIQSPLISYEPVYKAK